MNNKIFMTAAGSVRVVWFTAVTGMVLFLLAATPVFAAGSKVLNGHVPKVLKQLQSIAPLDLETNLNLQIGLPWRNQAALTNLLQALYAPASPQYHHYLTPAEFAGQFSPTEADYEKVIQFAQANGLVVVGKHGNRVMVNVRGKVADIEKTFHVTLKKYRHPNENRDFFAPDTEPSVDADLPILQVSGLDNYIVPHPASIQTMPVTNAMPAGGSGPGGLYAGYDFRKAYVPGTTLDGSGQMIGLLQFQSGFNQSDITAYINQTGLPNQTPVDTVLLDTYDGSPGYAPDEVTLDIEMAIAMAPGVSRIVVFEGWFPNNILNAMAASNQVKQLSCSWVFAANAMTHQIYQQFAAQGQTFFIGSGDGGAWVNGLEYMPLSPPYPASDDPDITIVGGTVLSTTNNGAWTSESVWPGSSGGVSTQYTIPTWQQGIDMIANQGSTTMRNGPDVAMPAQSVYLYYNGTWGGAGGTSAASPLWAGFMALVNQQAAAQGKPSGGLINPALYAIGTGPDYTNCFHDITVGNNFNGRSPANYVAAPGYDLCTGWGTPNGTNLINALTQLLPPIPSLTPSVVLDTNGTVYAASTRYVYAITNGIQKWAFYLGNSETDAWTGMVSTPALGPDGRVYVTVGNGTTLFAINPDGTQQWSFTATNRIVSSPAIGFGVIYFLADSGTLYAIGTNGLMRWTVPLSAGSIWNPRLVSSPAIVDNGTVYVGSGAPQPGVFAVNPDGSMQWTYAAGNSSIQSSPAVGPDGTIYIGAVSNTLYAINPDGSMQWTFEGEGAATLRSSPAVSADGTVYVGSDDGNLYSIANGNANWTFGTGGPVRSSPAIANDGTVYFGSDDGGLYAIYCTSPLATNAPWPMFQKDLRHTASEAAPP